MSNPPYTVTIVSHTHWDREWYQPFQVFRLQLVHLVDTLLDLLDRDPEYHSFLLDGQTIVLEDYLAIRPERKADLKRHIQQGRLMIGPWHILPDEFLVSPEATVRNLMLGAAVCARFGARMTIGYTPDPFGHVSQLPQILAGCGLDAAALQRGLSDEPTEIWWEAPDGTRLLTIYFRAGYGNLAWAPTTSDAFTHAVERQLERLAPHAHTPHLLLLNGTDHMLPQPELPTLIAQANKQLDGRAVLTHGTLPGYVSAVRQTLDGTADLPVVRGELRSSKNTPVLPGVYSARMWIKQANHVCQVALEQYAEPVSALAQVVGGRSRSGELWQAWRYLIENHPHDSICGCSIDQVHDEMRTRFAWSRQIAQSVTETGLNVLAGHINRARFSLPPVPDDPHPPTYAATFAQSDGAVLVYNPVPSTHSAPVEITARWAGPRRRYRLFDQAGHAIPYRILAGDEIIAETRTIVSGDLSELLDQIEIGFYKGRLISDASVWIEGDTIRIELILPEYHTGQIGDFSKFIRTLRHDPRLDAAQSYHLTTYLADQYRIAFVAEDVPGVGYRAYWLANTPTEDGEEFPADEPTPIVRIENEWLRVAVDPDDGTLTVTDKATGRTLRGLNRVQDGGDRGDEYNYCPPETDTVVMTPARSPEIMGWDEGAFGQVLAIQATYNIPVDLTADRAARAAETVAMTFTCTARLLPESRRVDIHTECDNRALNHRLRVLFPTGVASGHVIVDGHFDRLQRYPDTAGDTTGWAEQPAATSAQRAFSAIEHDGAGLLVAVQGLPEYEHVREAAGSTLAVTLLRAVGWLSRDDLVCRPGHAGPERPTPGAQCLGPAVYDYSVIPFGAGAFGLAQAAHEAYAFIAPLRGTAVEVASGMLPPVLTFLTLDPVDLVLTAIKPAEIGEGVIVRFYNSSDAAVAGRLVFGWPMQHITTTNLLETPSPLPLTLEDAHTVTLDVPAKRIVTLHVIFEEITS